MRNSFQVRVLVATALVVSLLGFSGCSERSTARVPYVSKYEPIEFTFPVGWFENPAEHPYDLQCFSPDQSLNTAVFAYRAADLEAGTTPLDILYEQIADIASKRQNWQEHEPKTESKYDDKVITSITYTGQKIDSRYCYRYSLITFNADDSKFAVVLQVGFPEDWQENKLVFDPILRSARLISTSATADIPAAEATPADTPAAEEAPADSSSDSEVSPAAP